MNVTTDFPCFRATAHLRETVEAPFSDHRKGCLRQIDERGGDLTASSESSSMAHLPRITELRLILVDQTPSVASRLQRLHVFLRFRHDCRIVSIRSAVRSHVVHLATRADTTITPVAMPAYRGRTASPTVIVSNAFVGIVTSATWTRMPSDLPGTFPS
jgi:hypothetical protein